MSIMDRRSRMVWVKELIRYGFTGLWTSVIGVGVFYMLDRWGLHYALANASSWGLAVLFAWTVNRTWVFRSRAVGLKELLEEGIQFAVSRLASGFGELLLLAILIDGLQVQHMHAKWTATIFVIAMNYLTGKLWVFKSPKDPPQADRGIS